MNPEHSPFDQLMAYLTHQMPETERAAFEIELAKNPALRQALDEEKALRDKISASVIRQKFKTIHTKLEAEGRIEPVGNQPSDPIFTGRTRALWFGLPVWQVAAASIVLLGALIAALYYWQESAQTLKPSVSERVPPPVRKPNFTPIPSSAHPTPAPITQHPPAPEPTKLPPLSTQEAYAYFKQLTMDLGIDHQLAQLSAADPTRSERTEVEELAEGRTLLRTGNVKAAIDALSPLANSSDGSEWSLAAQWYLAGAYLKSGKWTEGKAILQKIAQANGHPQQQAAQKLLTHKK